MPGLMFPKPTPTVLTREAKRRHAARTLQQAKADVRRRDGYRCRCCQKAGPGLQVHHVLFLSLRGHKTHSANLVLLCTLCHAKIHAHLIDIVGVDANRRLTFREAKEAL